MATDATGTPTSLGIPKFNTSVDAPSGLGSNAQMDAIDALIAARVSKPSGISAAEVPIWDGAQFVRGKLGDTNTGLTVSGVNTDLSFPSAVPTKWAGSVYFTVSTGGGSLRSIGAGSYAGQRLVLRNAAASSVTLLHQTAGGTGVQLFNRTVGSITLLQNEVAEYVYDGTNWTEIDRNQATSVGTGTELSYTEITVTPSKPGAVGSGNNVTIISPGALTFDGGPYMFEFFAPSADNPAGNNLLIELHDGTNFLGELVQHTVGSTALNGKRRFTPSAGSHTYTVKQWNSGNFPYGINCGAGGSNVLDPAFLRITKV